MRHLDRLVMAVAVLVGLVVRPAIAQTPDVSGRWSVVMNAPNGAHEATLTVKKDGTKLTGTISNNEAEYPIDGSQEGSDITLSFTYRGGDNPILVTMKGVQKGDSISGTATIGTSPGDWTAKRATSSGSAPAPGSPATAPAGALDISGPWLFEVNSPAGTGTPTITFSQSGEKLTGQYVGQLGEAPIEGTLKGADLIFTIDVTIQDTKFHIVYTGTATKDALKGKASFGDLGEGTFTARRK